MNWSSKTAKRRSASEPSKRFSEFTGHNEAIGSSFCAQTGPGLVACSTETRGGSLRRASVDGQWLTALVRDGLQWEGNDLVVTTHLSYYATCWRVRVRTNYLSRVHPAGVAFSKITPLYGKYEVLGSEDK